MIPLSKLTFIVELPLLNFPKFSFRFQKRANGTLYIFDVIRKKFVVVTPEEWVRQNMIHYLISEKQIPPSMISVEKQLVLNNTKKRTDVVVYNALLKPLLIIECKAPAIAVNQLTINQVSNYNLTLKVPFVLLTNGLNHICLKLNEENYDVLKTIPNYMELNAGY